jgi:hypothetical protein
MDKSFGKFIDVLEIVYAILMSWGFARVAEYLDIDNPFYWAGLVIAVFVLIRFFFAPSHNVGGLVRSIKMNLSAARKVIFLDIPILIAHSFIYYRLCYNLSINKYDLFYINYALLLILNAAWLTYIRKRLRSAKAEVPNKFCLWVNNNLVFSILIFASQILHRFFNLFTTTLLFWVCALFALANCIIDLASCALDYFEDV